VAQEKGSSFCLVDNSDIFVLEKSILTNR